MTDLTEKTKKLRKELGELVTELNALALRLIDVRDEVLRVELIHEENELNSSGPPKS